MHIHTPASYHWEDGYKLRGADLSARKIMFRRVAEGIAAADVAAVAIMDYWTFDGFLALRQVLSDEPELAGTKLILPGIELRVASPVPYRLHVHALLSDKLTDTQLSEFKSCLRLQSLDRALSDESLVEFASTLADDVAERHGFREVNELSDDDLWRLGSMTAEITSESLKKAKAELPSGSCFIVQPFDTYGGLQGLDWAEHSASAQFFMRSGDIFEVRSQRTADLFLGIRTEENDHFYDNFHKALGGVSKPVISGSDAHRISEYGVFPGSKVTWLKAQPTFEGLRQVVNEPILRSAIQPQPKKSVHLAANKTKFLKAVEIRKVENPRTEEAWFDHIVPLSTDLVAVIGNKGNGKSALADITALACRSQVDNFSFLNPDKFRDPKDNKADDFEARVIWEGGEDPWHVLSTPVSPEEVEKIKYIPQKYFEELCNEVHLKEGGKFHTEIMDVIFSHVPDEDRLGHGSLEDLLHYRTEEIGRRIRSLASNINALNKEIVAIEDLISSEEVKRLKNQIESKRHEIQVHTAAKPQAPTPAGGDENDAEANLRLAEISKELEEVNDTLESVRRALSDANVQVASLDRFSLRARALDEDVRAIRTEFAQVLAKAGLVPAEVLQVSIGFDEIKSAREGAAAMVGEHRRQLDPGTEGTPAHKQAKLAEERSRLLAELDEHSRQLEEFREQTREWEEKLAALTGDKQQEGPGLHGLEFELQKRETELPRRLNHLRRDRGRLTLQLFLSKKDIAQSYTEYYSPVEDFLDRYPRLKQKYPLRIDAALAEQDLVGGLLGLIHQGRRGSLYGEEAGRERVNSLVQQTDFTRARDVFRFLREIEHLLRFVETDTGHEPVDIGKQLVKGVGRLQLYDFLYGLSYIRVRYGLQLGGRDLPELSPGERGILLLMFYLLVAKDDRPLIIDQPEENLDGESVWEVLVPCVIEAKRRRQIILVTHSPNLAVVCDAEQIIHTRIDKSGNNRVVYTMGAIEDPHINDLVVDVLEGTWPAFSNRESKYLLLERPDSIKDRRHDLR